MALVFVQFCFASLAVAGKVALASLPPLVVAGIRMFLASLFLALIGLGVRRERLPARDALRLLALSLLGVVFNQILFLEGLARTTAVNASILIATIPVFTTLVAILVGQESARPVRIAGVSVSLVGALALLGIEGFQLRTQFAVGNVLVLLNAFSYSLYLVFSRSLLRRYRSTTVVSWTFLYGSLLITPLAALRATSVEFASVPALAWWAIAWIVIFPSVVSYSLNNYALKRIRSSTVATYVFLQPLFGITLALLLLEGEILTLQNAVGGALILLGVVLVSRSEALEPVVAIPESGEAMRRQPIVAADGGAEPQPQEDHQRRSGQDAP